MVREGGNVFEITKPPRTIWVSFLFLVPLGMSTFLKKKKGIRFRSFFGALRNVHVFENFDHVFENISEKKRPIEFQVFE